MRPEPFSSLLRHDFERARLVEQVSGVRYDSKPFHSGDGQKLMAGLSFFGRPNARTL